MLIKYLFEYILSSSSCCSLVVFSAQAKQLNWWKHFMFQFLGLSRLHRFCGYTPKHTHGYVKHTPCRHDDVVIVGKLKRETLRCEHRNDKLLWFNVHISICALILLFTHTQPHTHTLAGCSWLPFSQLNVISASIMLRLCDGQPGVRFVRRHNEHWCDWLKVSWRD